MNKTKVAIIDDERELQEELTRLFELDGRFEVVFCLENGRGAVAAIKRWAPDILILDHLMPYVNGLEVLEAMEATRVKVKDILFTTSNTQVSIRDKVLECGVTACITKPYYPFRIIQICADFRTIENTQKDYVGELKSYVTRKNMSMMLNEPESCAYEEERSRRYLRDLFSEGGIRYSCDGMNYMVEAVLSLCTHTNDKVKICDTYDAIGDLFNVSGSAIEKSIRWAIRDAWQKRCADPVKYDNCVLFQGFRKKPSNKELLLQCADRLNAVVQIYSWYR